MALVFAIGSKLVNGATLFSQRTMVPLLPESCKLNALLPLQKGPILPMVPGMGPGIIVTSC